MNWIQEYDLFLFDFDGLLVNTEELHYRAYTVMCKDRGFTLDWGFSKYFQIAQQDADAPRRYIYDYFPKLQQQEPNWHILYQEKKQAFLELLKTEPTPLLPGVEEFLRVVEANEKKCCVVTHSLKELVDQIRRQNPVLESIPFWITREDYKEPKPSPEGYLKAIHMLAAPGDKVIGFEDSGRGMRALMATNALPILINGFDSVTRERFQSEGVKTFSSFTELLTEPEL